MMNAVINETAMRHTLEVVSFLKPSTEIINICFQFHRMTSAANALRNEYSDPHSHDDSYTCPTHPNQIIPIL